ncbi:MAG TPA: enoyl-CoA hydratase/isomerase family protein [Bordetella sp.]
MIPPDNAGAPACLEIRAAVATLWLNRVQQANALSADLVEALIAHTTTAFADTALHTLVLRSAGRHFCSGFDMSDLEQQSDGDLLWRFVRIETLLDTLWNAPVRTIAVADSRAWGAGADLFAACDLRIALPQANFAFPGSRFGLVLGTRRLAARVGREPAVEIASAARILDAREAHRCGLASHLCDAEALDDLLAQLAGTGTAQRDVGEALRCAARAGEAALRDSDLAALVRSATRSGLKQRLADYRAAVRRSAGR